MYSDLNYLEYDHLAPGADHALLSWGFTPRQLNIILEWNFPPRDLARLMEGHPFPKHKIDFVIASLTKHLLSHNRKESDLTRIYWRNAREVRVNDLLAENRLARGNRPIHVTMAPSEPPPEPLRMPEASRNALRSVTGWTPEEL